MVGAGHARHDSRRDKTTMIPNLQLTDAAADAPEKPGTSASPSQPSGESGQEHVKLSLGCIRLVSTLQRFAIYDLGAFLKRLRSTSSLQPNLQRRGN